MIRKKKCSNMQFISVEWFETAGINIGYCGICVMFEFISKNLTYEDSWNLINMQIFPMVALLVWILGWQRFWVVWLSKNSRKLWENTILVMQIKWHATWIWKYFIPGKMSSYLWKVIAFEFWDLSPSLLRFKLPTTLPSQGWTIWMTL